LSLDVRQYERIRPRECLLASGRPQLAGEKVKGRDPPGEYKWFRGLLERLWRHPQADQLERSRIKARTVRVTVVHG